MVNNRRRYTIIGIVVIVILLVLGIGHHVSKTGGLFAPKTVSLKSSGERVWLVTDDGLKKDGIIDYIDVVKNGKFIEYQVFDDNITLGKVSKMSNSELISLGKKQDRKYFDESANEVRALRDGKPQIGLQNDLTSNKDLKNDLNDGAWLVATGHGGENAPTYTKMISLDQYDDAAHRVGQSQLKSGIALHNGPVVVKLTEGDILDRVNPGDSESAAYNRKMASIKKMRDEVRDARYNTLIENMKGVKYLAPKWQTLQFKNTTDDSGNKITSQRVKYKSIDEFNDADVMDQNVNNLSDSQKSKVLKAITSVVGRNGDVDAIRSAFDKSYYKVVTKDIFKPNTFSDYIDLYNPIHQKIYDSTYIGYETDVDGVYMVTKAQNDSQRAIFAK